MLKSLGTFQLNAGDYVHLKYLGEFIDTDAWADVNGRYFHNLLPWYYDYGQHVPTVGWCYLFKIQHDTRMDKLSTRHRRMVFPRIKQKTLQIVRSTGYKELDRGFKSIIEEIKTDG